MKKNTVSLKLKLDELNAKKAQYFFEIYDFETIIGDSEKKHFLGNKDPRICRFCTKSDKEVTFKSLAHVLPQFMGNKNLVSYFECDECNSLFGKYEDSFANFFGISRTFAQIKGKTKKVPKFKDPKTGLEVSLSDTGIQMSMIEGKSPIKIDLKQKSMEIITERPAYIPIHIPKTLIKIGLSMLQDTEIEDYDLARKFIIQSEKDEQFLNNDILRILGYFIPGPPKFPKPFAQLYRKKESSKDRPVPDRHLVVYYANYCFQLILPFSKLDESLRGKEIDLPVFPLLIDNSHFESFGEYQKLNLNLTSNEKRKSEQHKLKFSFETFDKLI
jgi:hypothetical protein